MLFRASMLEKNSREIQENIEMVNRQVAELEEFKFGLKVFEESKEKEMLSNLGKGVFVKTELKEKKLFVDVGSGVLVRKTAEEARKVVDSQIQKFLEARISLSAQLESLNTEMISIVEEIQKSRGEHVHGPNCNHEH